MAKITFITQDNETIITEGSKGTVMRLAVIKKVKGIDADCGGVCSCGTCHVYVAPEYMDKLKPASELEKDLLEFDDKATEYSRLSCQIKISEALDGMVLKVAR